MSKIEYGSIIDVENDELKLLNKKPKKFWKEVKFLGEGAFKKCSDLVEILIPKNVVMAHENPFEGCEKLEKFNIEEGNEELSTDGRALFYIDGKILVSYANASGEAYKIPEKVSEISSSAFKGCKNLKEVEISKSVATIGWGAFESSGLTEITIPKTVKNIYPEAFKDCSNLKEVKIETVSEVFSVEPETFNQLIDDESSIEKIVKKIVSMRESERREEIKDKYSKKVEVAQIYTAISAKKQKKEFNEKYNKTNSPVD